MNAEDTSLGAAAGCILYCFHFAPVVWIHETPWRRNWKDRSSPVSARIRLPISSSRDSDSGPNTPEVSTAKGHKVVANTEVGVLFCHSLLCLVCNRTGLPGSKCQMRGGIGIWECCIPYQGSTTLPRQHCCPIWPFPICK